MAQDLYRNRDFIPDFDELIAETAARSREFAQRADIRTGLPYGPGARERLDLILPQCPASGAPLHMFIHGGYWRSGNREDHWLIAAPVLAVGGIAAFISYDLMPGARLAAIVEQVRVAARHLAEMAPDLGADPTRLTVSGHSAGAHLASYLASVGPQESLQPALPPLRGMALVSGLYDLTDIPGSFLKDEAKMTPAEAAAWSPLTSRQLPGARRVIMLGEKDTSPFHVQAGQLSSLLDSQGLSNELRIEKGLNHLTIVLALGDPASRTGQLLSDLVAS